MFNPEIHLSYHSYLDCKNNNKKLNFAMRGALSHAKYRAIQEDDSIYVYVQNTKPFRTWFARNQSEGKPHKSHLFLKINNN